jgi:hypothetical protein
VGEKTPTQLGRLERATFNHNKYSIHEIVILPAVLHEYEACSLTSKKEHSVRVFVKSVLKRIFGTKGEGTDHSGRAV